jgi:hypothetical protein
MDDARLPRVYMRRECARAHIAGQFCLQNRAHAEPRRSYQRELPVFGFRAGSEPAVEQPGPGAAPDNFGGETDAQNDEGYERCDTFLRYTWTFSQDKYVHVWVHVQGARDEAEGAHFSVFAA